MKDVSATPYAQRLLELHLPRYGEIPRIDLYMDQLVGFLEETLAPLYQPDEKIITRSMVNNYVKQGVLAAATGKKYTRAHVAYLVVICTLKQTFSLSEIDLLIRRQIATFDTGVAYDYYCDAFEAAVRALFGARPASPQGLASGDARRLRARPGAGLHGGRGLHAAHQGQRRAHTGGVRGGDRLPRRCGARGTT